MRRVIVLDSGPLGLVTNPHASPANNPCIQWLRAIMENGDTVVIPEIADYEVRRELLRANKPKSLQKLGELKAATYYAPITTDAMLKAAELWAQARNQGKPTADPHALDGDVILAAQATLLAEPDNEVIVATTNVGHLSLFVDARLWEDIDSAV